MKKLTVFLIYFLSLTLARGADIGSTYFFTPDLANEGNPFQLFLGSWSGILLVQAGAFLVILALIALYCFGRSHRPKDADLSTREYASDCLYGHPHGIRKLPATILLSWPLPKNWFQYFRMMSFALANIVITASFLAALSWWLIHGWRVAWYNEFYGWASIFGWPGGGILIAWVAIVFALSVVLYYRIEHRQKI